MYEVKSYKDGGTESATTYYGVYHKCTFRGYREEAEFSGLDNLIVFCYSKENAEKIMQILTEDHDYGERLMGFK